jgi:hypothetical protein
MKSWQGILINGCITVLAVFVAIGVFTPDAPPDRTKEIQAALNAQVKDIQLKLNAIEDAVLKQKEQAVITPAPSEPAKESDALPKLDQKLDMILGKLAVIENQSSRTQAPQNFGRSLGPPPTVPPQLPPSFSVKGRNPTNWIDSLSDDKKREVEIIFEEHLQRMRDKLPPPGSDGRAPDRETVVSIMEENDLLLRQELKTILNEEEYQQFLNVHPGPVTRSPKPPGGPWKP